jgi:hypothetical protein
VALAEALAEEQKTLTRADSAAVVAGVAHALAQAGQAPQAVRLAERAAQLACTATELVHRDSTLSIVAEALVKAGRLSQALQTADTITDPIPRASALATTAAAHGPTTEGRTLLRRALSLHSHATFLHHLAAVAPEALEEAVRCSRPGAL